MSVLKYGSKGAEVKNLQSQLNKLGFRLTIDGEYGPATSRAVSDFQEQNNLKMDGVCGSKTQEFIALRINAKIGVAVKAYFAAVDKLPENKTLLGLLM